MKLNRDPSLVTIVTPVYNSGATIADCIDSVLAQSYENWELVLVDDCSSDNSEEQIRRYLGADKRIFFHRLQENSGPAAARNFAINEANGRWIAFLDSDDVWLPEKLERTIRYAITKNSALTYTAYKRIDTNGQVSPKIIVPETLTKKQLLGNTAILTSSVIVDLEKVGAVRMRDVYYDDFVCWLEILSTVKCAFGLNEPLVHYRLTPGSVSRNKVRSAFKVWRIYRDVEGLSFASSVFNFINYSANALFKYMRF
jgi:teichuronic acid biosynthesis glycosyltransferase TuaG